jgi:hypothetical protein
MLALTNATAFHVGVFRTVDRWDINVSAPSAAKLHAVISLALWVSVIACGRLLAYL